ncbi:MAG: uroporphyrinogen decarboxylase family protein [bacterium]|jgi:uroporphyrinogen decarboxylase|nr:uroporphyrinogen decarboxylase family protein [candidate division KSB1 bacterium]MDH7558770.1 uroporphyrinogen decarboxylase family protein [bacterium]
MTTRERFLAALEFTPADRLPNLEFGYWEATIRRWHDEGLPSHLRTGTEVEAYFGLEGVETFDYVPVINGLWPPFTRQVLAEQGGRRLVRDENGVLYEELTDGESIPRYVKFPIASPDDWEAFKRERLDWSREDRVTSHIGDFVRMRHQQGRPVRFDAGSLYGWLRNWMGVENLSIALMTEPGWVAAMMDHLKELTIHLLRAYITPALAVDVAWWWEDMCYNHGPLISPRLFEQFMVPRYKESVEELRAHGITHSVVDCDGKIDLLVPGWLRAGIRVMFPVEALHTSPLRLREEHGDQVLMIGGVNKFALIAGPAAIDQELESLSPLVAAGGYIPSVDHRVPPDVSLENYRYYLAQKERLLSATMRA